MRGHLLFQLAHLPPDVIQFCKRRMQHIVHRVASRVVWDLRDEPHLFVGRKDNCARVVVQLAGEDFKERRLARTVFAKQAHPLAGLHIKCDTV